MELNLSLPGNPRYQPKELVLFFGYDYLYRGLADVEIANLLTLGDIGVISQEEIALLSLKILERLRGITTTDVDKVERDITKHDVRAWVRLAQEILDPRIARWVHVLLTSYDALDSGRILNYVRAYDGALKPATLELIGLMSELVKRFSGHIQIGRTHGQHALPITVGFWLATILNRILYCAQQMDIFVDQLVGKISGAVGAYNAQVGLGIAEKCGQKTFEQRVLEKLNLKPTPISTQILPPEPLSYFLYSCCMLSAALAQFGRDGRNLMRSEIAEVVESFEVGQVGSSTMAQKRNPITFENIEAQWICNKNEFGKVMDTLISEHQRDLVGSRIMRDFPIILINLQYQLNTLRRKNKDGVPFLSRITVDAEACQRNFNQSAGVILAEPLYIALQMAGYNGDAHELVNRTLMPISANSRMSLIEALETTARSNDHLQEVLEKIPDHVLEVLHHPEQYTGSAESKALEIAEKADDFVAISQH